MRRILLTSGVIVVGIVAVLFGVNTFTRGIVQDAAYRTTQTPIASYQRTIIRVYQYLHAFFERSQLIDERDRLIRENEALRAQKADSEQLQRDNDRLRRQLAIGSRQTHRLTDTTLFTIQRNALVSTALVAKGRLDGIQPTMAVVNGGNMLIGVVSEVFDHTARILLTDDPRLLINVRVSGSSLVAQSRGILGDMARIDLVSKTETINENDTLVTTGLDRLPEGLVVGIVQSVKNSSTGLFKDVRAKTLFNPSHGAAVFIILP